VLAGFSAEQIATLGPALVDGTFTIGVSATTGSEPRLVCSMEKAIELVSSIEPDDVQEFFPGLSAAGIVADLVAAGDITVIEGDCWMDWGLWEIIPGLAWLDMAGGPRGLVHVVPLGGPLDNSWRPEAVVAPILRYHLRAKLSSEPRAYSFAKDSLEALSGVNLAISELMERLNVAHSTLARRDTRYGDVKWSAEQWLDDAIIANLAGAVLEKGVGSPDARVPLDALGPGARRSLALAGLELYRDPELWPLAMDPILPRLALLLLEEPEAGLHPAAQRQTARRLKDWSTYGLQLLMVTHSPAFVNAAPIEGVRLARHRLSYPVTNTIIQPADLREIQKSLGIKPSDILLARRFLVVEGESDRLVLQAWAARIGADLKAHGIQVVPAGGHGKTSYITRFMELAYETADFVLLLDGGPETAQTKRSLTRQFGERVRIVRLKRTSIESYFAPKAVVAWLRLHGAADPALEGEVARRLQRQANTVRVLSGLADRHLGRSFDKVKDGSTIARLTGEEDIPPEIKTILVEVLEDT